MPVSENAKKFKELRERAGESVRGLARLIGWGHTRVQYYEDVVKTKYLPQDFVELIVPHLVGKGTPPIDAREILALAGMSPPVADHSQTIEASNISAPIDSPPPLPHRQDMPKDVPVLGMSVGGATGEFSMNGDIHDFARRPPGIAHRKDVFACWVDGESMVPWRQPRELVYVERTRRPEIGDHVVVELKAVVDDVRPAFVKRLVKMTGTKVIVAQYNPAKEIEYDRKRVHHIYRVMPWSEVLGINS